MHRSLELLHVLDQKSVLKLIIRYSRILASLLTKPDGIFESLDLVWRTEFG
jgi:hypothetical protein